MFVIDIGQIQFLRLRFLCLFIAVHFADNEKMRENNRITSLKAPDLPSATPFIIRVMQKILFPLVCTYSTMVNTVHTVHTVHTANTVHMVNTEHTVHHRYIIGISASSENLKIIALHLKGFVAEFETL